MSKEQFHIVPDGGDFKWYIRFESFVLCHAGTTKPMAFNSCEECQQWIDNNCDPREFPEVDFIQAENPQQVIDMMKSKGGAK